MFRQMNNGGDINQIVENIIRFYDMGRNPNELMQMYANNNPNFSQMKNQIQVMSQGRTPSDFLMQLARQNGVTEKNLEGLARILGVK